MKAPFYGIYVCLLDDSSALLPPLMVPGIECWREALPDDKALLSRTVQRRQCSQRKGLFKQSVCCTDFQL